MNLHLPQILFKGLLKIRRRVDALAWRYEKMSGDAERRMASEILEANFWKGRGLISLGERLVEKTLKFFPKTPCAQRADMVYYAA